MAMQLMTAKRVLKRTLSGGGRRRGNRESISSVSNEDSVPKGHLAVYVGRTAKKRMVIPVAFLNHPLFRELLQAVEEDFGYYHPMGGITIPCSQHYFLTLISMIEASN